LTLFETCEILGKSSRTVTRYVHRHILHPRGIKSRQGTLEYRFSKTEVEALRQRQNELGLFDNYNEAGEQRQTQVASFASLSYPPAVREQMSFIIPGVSFPVAGSSSSPAQPAAASPQLGNSKQTVSKEEIKEPLEPAKNDKKDTAPLVFPMDIPAGRSNSNNEEIIAMLKETTGMLRDQLKVKDDQIKNLDDKLGQLIERNRETNILLKGMQDKMGLLDKPKEEDVGRMDRTEQSHAEQPVQKTEAQDESQRPIPSPSESDNGEPVKVKLFSMPAEGDPLDTRAKVAPGPARNDYQSPRVKTGKYGEPVKKGLFGKIFG